MDDVKTPSREERKSALSGLGTSRKRVEMLDLLKVKVIM